MYFSYEYTNITNERKPQSFIKTIETEDRETRTQAMQEEIQSLKDTQAYNLVKLLKERKALKNKLVFKIKSKGNNTSYHEKIL